MPAHYQTLKDQLIVDLRDVFGQDLDVIFGRARRELNRPAAIIRTTLRRENYVRRVHEMYSFDIEVRLDVDDIPDSENGCEPYVMQQAEYLVDKLAPHDTTTTPTPAGLYAGIGNPRYVRSVQYVETEDAQDWVGFRLEFYTEATVLQ